jgi:hypothetical protein
MHSTTDLRLEHTDHPANGSHHAKDHIDHHHDHAVVHGHDACSHTSTHLHNSVHNSIDHGGEIQINESSKVQNAIIIGHSQKESKNAMPKITAEMHGGHGSESISENRHSRQANQEEHGHVVSSVNPHSDEHNHDATKHEDTTVTTRPIEEQTITAEVHGGHISGSISGSSDSTHAHQEEHDHVSSVKPHSEPNHDETKDKDTIATRPIEVQKPKTVLEAFKAGDVEAFEILLKKHPNPQDLINNGSNPLVCQVARTNDLPFLEGMLLFATLV